MTDAPLDGKPARRKRRIMPWLALILLVGVFGAGVVLAPRIMAALPAWITGGDAPRPLAAAPALPATAGSSPAEPSAAQPSQPAASGPNLPVPVPDVGDFARQLADLQTQVSRLQGEEDADAATTEAVTSMGAQIAHLLNQLSEQQQRLSALEATSPKSLVTPMAVLGVARLRQAVEQGSSYAGALDGVRRLTGAEDFPLEASAALATLDAHSKDGVASALVLRDGFAARIEDILDADAVPEAGSWWERSWARLTAMVSVRPTGDVAGQDTPAIVARAETALNRGDVDKAEAEVERLPARARAAVDSWLDQARARQAALGAVDTLETALLAAAAPKNEGATP